MLRLQCNHTVYTCSKVNAAAWATQLLGLERDMQSSLRMAIGQLEPGLLIADGGTERSVTSGFIDTTAMDDSDNVVVIELKTGKARRDAVGQILGYMGDVAADEPGRKVPGILSCGRLRQQGACSRLDRSNSVVTALRSGVSVRVCRLIRKPQFVELLEIEPKLPGSAEETSQA